MVKQGLNKPFKYGGAIVMYISMQHVVGGGLGTCSPSPLLPLTKNITCSEIVSEASHISVILGEQNFGSYYTEHRLHKS